MGFNFNLKDQLTFYGSYHNNKWNQLIHLFFVPLILWTVAVWLAYTGPLFPYDFSEHLGFLPDNLSRFVVLNASFIVLSAYSLYYIILDFLAGLSWTLVYAIPLWLTSTAFEQLVPNAWAIALGLHVFAWYMQIHPGHLVLEGRKPALFDSFFQSLVLAPLFVWFEVLFAAGYRKELHAEIQARIAANIAHYKAEKEALLAQPAK